MNIQLFVPKTTQKTANIHHNLLSLFWISVKMLHAVMTAHIFNRNIDPDYPATLSYKTLTEVLRNQLHFDGVILTDDMYMQGIVDNYAIEDAIALAINAGADMLVMGNNITTGYEPDRPFKVVQMIVDAVKAGKISAERLRESYERIKTLKNRLK